MDFTLWISFIGTVLVITFTPGPSVLLATSNSMNYGVRKTTGTILGDLSANLLQIILASLGFASIVMASGEFFHLIKWIGVGYLVYIGVKKILAKPKSAEFIKTANQKGFYKLYAEGFLMSASNPKAIVFFAAIFPLFITNTLPLLPQIVILAVSYLLIDGISLLVYSQFANRLKGYLESKEKIHLQNKIVGSMLILSGLMLSMVRRTNN